MSEETLVVEQSHRLEATYTDESGKKKRGQFRASAKNKSDAINKVGVALSQRHYKDIDVKHLGIDEAVEEIDESKTYRADPDNKPAFANRVRNMKKKLDKAAHDRAEDKRHVDESETEEDETDEDSDDEHQTDIGKESEEVNEISKGLANRYADKVEGSLVKMHVELNKHKDDKDFVNKTLNKMSSRSGKQALANMKANSDRYIGTPKRYLPKVPATNEEEILDEKDIGKKGKNFDKIADKADKEYGSKEAGERVAGAILAKLRAKHPHKYSAKVAKEK